MFRFPGSGRLHRVHVIALGALALGAVARVAVPLAFEPSTTGADAVRGPNVRPPEVAARSASAPASTSPTASHGAEPAEAVVRAVNAMIARTHHAFVERGGEFVAGTVDYERHVRPDGRLELTVRHGHAVSEVALGPTRIARGGVRLDSTAPPAISAEGRLERSGAVVERFENDARGLEQSWVLARAPEGVGDLVVQIAVRGAANVVTNAGGVHLGDRAGLGVRYGHATVVDASGRSTPVPVAFRRGALVLEVPGALLDQATYPLVIDPLLGAETAVDGPAPGAIMPGTGTTSIAWNGTQYLAVWADGRSGGAGPGIYASRVTASGDAIDVGGFPIATPSGSIVDLPDVASNGTDFLVAYRSYPAIVEAVRVDGSGTVLDATPLLLDAQATDPATRPRVASDGSGYVVTWMNRAIGVAANGTVGTLDEYTSVTAFDAVSAVGSSTYLFVASDGTPTLQFVRYSTLDGSWTLVAQPDFGSLNAKSAASLACLASDGECRVVWVDSASSAGPIAMGTLSAPTTSTPLNLGSSPAVVRLSGTTEYVTYVRGPNDLAGTLVTNMVAGPTDAFANNQMPGGPPPRMATDGTTVVVAAYPDAQVGFATGTGGAITAVPVARQASNELEPALATNANGSLVAWRDDRVPVGVYSGRLAPDGTALDSVGRLVAATSPFGDASPAVGTDGTDFAVVWFDGDGFMLRVEGSSGNPIGAGPVTAYAGHRPEITYGAGRYLVVGTDSGHVYTRTVDAASGVPDGAVPSDLGAGSDPAVASNGTGFLVAWEVGGGVRGGRLDAAGTPLDPGGFPLSSGAIGQKSVSLASDGADYLAVWSDQRNGFDDLYGTRVDASGAVLDAGGIAISTASGPQLRPSLTFEGREYVAAWEDGRFASYTLFATRISPNGLVEDAINGTPLTAGISAGFSRPVLGSAGGGVVMLVYNEVLNTTPPFFYAYRVTARAVRYGSRNGSLCSAASECDSGLCVDGVCCATACAGGSSDCRACSVLAGALVDGVCGVVQRSSNTVCRPSADGCDAAEVCDGSSTTCPADVLAPPGQVCRAATGVCDLPETCDGSTAACPADARTSAGTTCRAAVGACDVEERCDGASPTCPSDGYLASGSECRASAGACDVAEVCSGAGAGCPGDALLPVGTACRLAAGVCDVTEYCIGIAACPIDGFAGNTTQCDVAHGECDFADFCTGASATCPETSAPDGTQCDDRFGCTEADACVAGACVGQRSAAGRVCRTSAGGCDLAETCDGVSDGCPADAVRPVDDVCRPSVGPCDAPEICDGYSPACPGDVRFPAGTRCRPSIGACDFEEQCTGASASCPADTFLPVGAICRGANGPCDASEYCDGSGSCPTDARAADGTPCDDGLGCSLSSSCNAGVCSAYATLDCSDGDPCTTDSCVEPSGCTHTAVPACMLDAGTDGGLPDASSGTDAGPVVIIVKQGCSCRVAGVHAPAPTHRTVVTVVASLAIACGLARRSMSRRARRSRSLADRDRATTIGG